ncbi:MAG: ABC transporter permease [Candidatus Heimdallarchaeota archaeon]|nr:ABC transporter permease [Candidatus Heimdallarchaeota archaeon]
MIESIFAEVKKCLRYKQYHKIFSAIALLPPLALGIFFISAFTFTSSSDSGFTMVIVNYDTHNVNGWTDQFIDTMDSREGTIPYFVTYDVDEVTANEMFDTRETFLIVYIPDDFSSNLTTGLEITINAKINNVHEDVSKNIRLGLESRIYDFSQAFELATGNNPGCYVDKTTVYPTPLPRPDYMISGVIIFGISLFALLDGALLGTSEKEGGTDIEIAMANHGQIKIRLGKILATILSSFINTLILLILITILYGQYFPTFISFIQFIGVLLLLSFTFAVLGVNYGLKVGDFRAVPGPSILITMTLWMIGGAINPLEFSAGSAIFRYLPSAAGIRVLTAIIYDRSMENLTEGWVVLSAWASIAFLALVIIIVKNMDKN